MAEAKAKEKEKSDRPIRPRSLRLEIVRLYVLLAFVNCFFIALSFSLHHPVKEGFYEKADGTLIKLSDFDPKELGPYPKCHEHFGQHLGKDGKTWVNNSDIVGDAKSNKDDQEIDYPVGHPQNKAWVAKRKAIENESKLTFSALQPSIHLLLLSVVVVYLGCKHAVWFFTKPDPKLDHHDKELEEDMGQSSLQESDAYWFPIMGSCVLFGLFLVYKYLDSDWIKYLLSCYVVVMCANGLGINIGQFVAVIYNSRGLRRYKTLFRIPYLDVDVTWVDIVAYMFSCALGVFYIQTRNWIVNNIMGLSFCLLGLKHIGISTYRTGLILLCGLFLYDIFWVFFSEGLFGSNVMVSVATGVQAPIKLMFPRSGDGCGDILFSMLGLGDIVVPGLVISLLAKFDQSRPDAKENPGWVYLNVTMVSYALSLITTVVVMLVFNHAQPALLYIVPYVIVSSFGTALYKGQVKDLFAFEVEDTLISLEDDKKEKKEN